jgi:hypothetical protein
MVPAEVPAGSEVHPCCIPGIPTDMLLRLRMTLDSMTGIKQTRWFRFFVRHWPWLTVVAATLLAWWIAHMRYVSEHQMAINFDGLYLHH